jgi:peptidyl-prolyl cis-trans isomerase B (cyclophilin B)
MRRTAIVTITIALLSVQTACTLRRSPPPKAPDRAPSTAASPDACEWIATPDPGPSWGTPPVNPPRQGSLTLTFGTNLGTIEVQVDRSAAPCTAASLEFLARARFYDGVACHRLVPPLAALQCGDPIGSGYGGPGYRFADENLPGDADPAYLAGDVAMVNTGEPATNGSQFFFVYGPTRPGNSLPGLYTLFGRVTDGLDIIQKVGAAGDDGFFAPSQGGGHPKRRITVESVQVHAA